MSEVAEGFGDAEQGGPSMRATGLARGQPQQTGSLTGRLGGGVVGEGDEVAQIGMEQVGVIGQEDVAPAGGGSVGRQGA